MGKIALFIVTAVGFLSALAGLMQAFSFTHLPQLEGSYFCGSTDNSVMEFLRDLEKYQGQVVMLRFDMCTVGFARRISGDSIYRHFESETFLEAANINAFPNDESEWDAAMKEIDAKLSRGTVSMKDILHDNGTFLVLNGIGQKANAFSSVSVGSEGTDSAFGPFQIAQIYENETIGFLISPAPTTDRLAAEVRCAMREWPKWQKFLLCPFM